MLGTGSALPSPNRVQSGVLVEEGDRALLLDCGSGVCHRLAQTQVSYRDVDTVLLTHLHLDHVADLPTLLRAQRLAGDAGALQGLRSRLLGSDAELTVVGPPGTSEACGRLFRADPDADEAEVRVEERALDDFPTTVSGFRIDAAETDHPGPAFAYRFGDELVVSGDTGPTTDVLALAEGVDTLIHECAYPDGTETDGHTTPTALGRGLADVRVDRVVLTHLFPRSEPEADGMAATVSEHTSADVSVAEDLVSFEISS